MGRLCAEVEGFNLQAATRIPAGDREALEQVARYLARPPIGTDRLTALPDGRVALRLKGAWSDGTEAIASRGSKAIARPASDSSVQVE
jgi:hypothetical protein